MVLYGMQLRRETSNFVFIATMILKMCMIRYENSTIVILSNFPVLASILMNFSKYSLTC